MAWVQGVGTRLGGGRAVAQVGRPELLPLWGTFPPRPEGQRSRLWAPQVPLPGKGLHLLNARRHFLMEIFGILGSYLASSSGFPRLLGFRKLLHVIPRTWPSACLASAVAFWVRPLPTRRSPPAFPQPPRRMARVGTFCWGWAGAPGTEGAPGRDPACAGSGKTLTGSGWGVEGCGRST